MVDVSGSDGVEQTTDKVQDVAAVAPVGAGTEAEAPVTSSAKAPAKAQAKAPVKAAAKTAAKTAGKSSKPAKTAPKAGKADKAGKAAKPAKPDTPVPTPAPAVVAPEPVMAEPKLVKSAMPVVTGPEMKKKDLVEKVVKRAGVKKKDAKLVVEAMLAVLGEALAEGRELNLQPMGRLKTTRVKEVGTGRVLICRLRQGGGEGKGGKEALAEDDD